MVLIRFHDRKQQSIGFEYAAKFSLIGYPVEIFEGRRSQRGHKRGLDVYALPQEACVKLPYGIYTELTEMDLPDLLSPRGLSKYRIMQKLQVKTRAENDIVKLRVYVDPKNVNRATGIITCYTPRARVLLNPSVERDVREGTKKSRVPARITFFIERPYLSRLKRDLARQKIAGHNENYPVEEVALDGGLDSSDISGFIE